MEGEGGGGAAVTQLLPPAWRLSRGGGCRCSRLSLLQGQSFGGGARRRMAQLGGGWDTHPHTPRGSRLGKRLWGLRGELVLLGGVSNGGRAVGRESSGEGGVPGGWRDAGIDPGGWRAGRPESRAQGAVPGAGGGRAWSRGRCAVLWRPLLVGAAHRGGGGGRGAPCRAVSLHGLSRGARRGRDWGGGLPPASPARSRGGNAQGRSPALGMAGLASLAAV